jgi:hypothetical protein
MARERNENIQIRKEEIKLSLSVDDIILYLKDPKYSIKRLLHLINTFGNAAECKVNIQNSIVFLYTSNEQAEKKLKKIFPFTLRLFILRASEKIKYLVINLTKEGGERPLQRKL